MTTDKKRLRARQMPPEQRKQQLLELAVKAFAEKGIGAAKHADVAKAAGVSVPTVFTYFPTRQALEEEVLGFAGNFIIDNVVKPSMDSDEQMDRLYASGPLWLDAVENHPDYIKVWLMWSNHFAPEVLSLYLDFEARLISKLVELLYFEDDRVTDLQEKQDRARMLLGAATMLAQLGFRGEKRSRQQAYIRHVIDNFMV